jgi:pyruvate ferredoxin oxidoreductase gamma subunit
MLEIRFHGRGGHGVKTAAIILAEAFLKKGKHVQAFPEFGPERRGAPVKSFARISDEKITTHEPIENPDFVIILDDSLVDLPEIVEGFSPKTIFIINSAKGSENFKNLPKPRTYAIDASKISMETIGKAVVNTVMLGALAGIMDENIFNELKEEVYNTLKSKDEKIAMQNVKAMEIAFNEMKKQK